jgi:excinuclease ABC subunit C
VNEIILFLRGRTPELLNNVRDKMEAAAAEQRFEAAAAYRNKLFALEKTLEKQVVFTADFKDRDVIGMARQESAVQIMCLSIRGGFLLGSRPFYFSETMDDDDELVTSFVKQYYEKTPFIPKEILLSVEPKDRILLETWLRDQKREKVFLTRPQKGEKAKLIQMANQNARMQLRENLNAVFIQEEMLARVQRRLSLQRRPDRIECFDLSNVGGAQGVGCMVVFDKGMPFLQGYRKYRIRKAAQSDDYAMLREVLTRRYKEGSHRGPLPDLLMVDGGKGQLNVAVSVLQSLGLHGAFDLVGIAKTDPKQEDVGDKIYKPGRKNPVKLARAPEVLLFLQRIRDEAHRYVITYHRKRRLLTYRRSVLENIPGIGTQRRSRLLKHFGSLKRIREASLEELRAVPGMTQPAIESLLRSLNNKKKNGTGPGCGEPFRG